jgi:hypothetical protein
LALADVRGGLGHWALVIEISFVIEHWSLVIPRRVDAILILIVLVLVLVVVLGCFNRNEHEDD